MQPRVGALGRLCWEDSLLDDELLQWVKQRLHGHTQDLEWGMSFHAPGVKVKEHGGQQSMPSREHTAGVRPADLQCQHLGRDAPRWSDTQRQEG